MTRIYSSLLAVSMVLSIAAAGCSSIAPTAATATQIATPAAKAETGVVTASGSVEPVQTSNMAFLLAAPVKEIDVKAGDQVKAGQTLVVLDTPTLQYAVTGAEAELKSAQANATLQHMATKKWNPDKMKFVYTSGPPELRQIADARVVQAHAALEVAQANLALGTLVAPFDGTVVSIDIVPGEMVAPSKAVLTIGDLSNLRVETTDLSEREIAQVKIGQSATVRLKAFSQDLTGKVIAIAPLSTLHNGDNVYKVTIQLGQAPQGLMWGMTGDVSIAVGK